MKKIKESDIILIHETEFGPVQLKWNLSNYAKNGSSVLINFNNRMDFIEFCDVIEMVKKMYLSKDEKDSAK